VLAAEALADEGIDVIGQHVDTPTPQIVAQERGIYSTGHHRDLSEFSSATQCSSIWVWDKYLAPEIKKIEAPYERKLRQDAYKEFPDAVQQAIAKPEG